MTPTICHRPKVECCAIGAYWRELADAEQACNALLREDRDGLLQVVDRLRLVLRERDKEIASLMKRKRLTSEYSYRKPEPMRRRA